MKPRSICLLVVASIATIPSMTCNAQSDPTRATWRGQSVSEFTPEQNAELGWQVVNDGVMGGLSKGNVEFTDDGTMRFFGDLSLDNNGGFSLVRSEAVDYNLSNDLGLLLRVRGDGRTYEARLESDARFRNWAVSFSGKFETTKGEWQQVKIPFSAFEGGFRGQSLPDKVLNPAQIKQIGIILAGQQAGPFELEVDWIRTYGKGQGDLTEREQTPDDRPVASATSPKRNLIDTAVADGRFGTFKKALDAAGLTVFFQWDNPLTVFAPTDEAFAKLPQGTLANLLKPENKSQLVEILSHHVSPGKHLLAAALADGSIEPVKGAPLAVTFSNAKVMINDAALIDADVECNDGVIHVIDSVLLPSGLNLSAAGLIQ